MYSTHPDVASPFAADDHALRVAALTEEVARRLGLDADTCALFGRAAALHDVGKAHVRASILDKPGPLTAGERAEVERHTLLGASLLRRGADAVHQTARVIALTHHERWDGSGYPFGLRAQEIPLAGRIVAVADVYDCLRAERAYKAALSERDACALIRAGSGSQFDPVCVNALLAVVGASPYSPRCITSSTSTWPRSGRTPPSRAAGAGSAGLRVCHSVASW